METLKILKGQKKTFTAYNAGKVTCEMKSDSNYTVVYYTPNYKTGVSDSINYKSVNKRKTLVGANNACIDFGVKSFKRM